MPRGVELQFRTRSRLYPTERGEALTIKFNLGPLEFFIIANLPEHEGENGKTPLAYVKFSLDSDSLIMQEMLKAFSKTSDVWELFKDHGMSRHKTEG